MALQVRAALCAHLLFPDSFAFSSRNDIPNAANSGLSFASLNAALEVSVGISLSRGSGMLLPPQWQTTAAWGRARDGGPARCLPSTVTHINLGERPLLRQFAPECPLHPPAKQLEGGLVHS
jgi:hypothetical protein